MFPSYTNEWTSSIFSYLIQTRWLRWSARLRALILLVYSFSLVLILNLTQWGSKQMLSACSECLKNNDTVHWTPLHLLAIPFLLEQSALYVHDSPSFFHKQPYFVATFWDMVDNFTRIRDKDNFDKNAVIVNILRQIAQSFHCSRSRRVFQLLDELDRASNLNWIC